jgi:hypothetical protein
LFAFAKTTLARILDRRMAGRQAVRSSLEDAVIQVLERFGVADALDLALRQAGTARVPATRDESIHFFESTLLDVLTGQVHPSTARTIIDEILEHIASPPGSGTHLKGVGREHQVATVPPPPMESGHNPYDDLASGAVHTRATPTWGLRRVFGKTEGAIVWIVVSQESELRERIKANAPIGTEFVAVETLGELKAALERGDHPASSVVIDAARPSLPLDQLIAVLIEDALGHRVVLWRMDSTAYQRLLDAVPVARTWLTCEAEVTPIEITQLIGA